MSRKSNILRQTTASPTPRPSRWAPWPRRSASDGRRDLRTRLASPRGTALLETALTLPLLLLVSISIFEFGRAYQTWQVVTNAAREGARIAVLPNATLEGVQARVKQYLQDGQLADYASADVKANFNVSLNIGATTASGTLVTVTYPFQFMVLQPVANLVVKGSTLGGSALPLTATAEMRNEIQ